MNYVTLTASYFSYFYRLGVIIYFPDVLLNLETHLNDKN
jgi:hypothetical protein